VQRFGEYDGPHKRAVQAAPRGILEISKLNLDGTRGYAVVEMRGEATLQGRALLGYSSPNTFGESELQFSSDGVF